ncbi:MAG: BtrH N-terminal domain-containing protein [Syntrophaceae bacterium]
MKRVLLPVRHRPGRHCASTAICNVVNFHGIAFSEALCFGIGAGLGIWYLDTGSLKPGRMVHVRSADIEAQFFNRMGCAFSWQQFKDPLDAQKALCRTLDKGLPALVQTDIYYLPYYGSKTHFPGHDITVWGYDPTEGVFLITDTERTVLLSVPFENMRRALYAGDGFFTLEGNLFSPESLDLPPDLPAIIRAAISHNSRVILSGGYDFQGIAGLEKWMREITEEWPQLADWQWAARFAYQVIERRGTGGGGFRLMYADFLEQASASCPEVKSRGLSTSMREIGGAWTALALALKDASEVNRPDFSAVLEGLRRVHRIEAAYHHEAVSIG